MNEEEIKQTTFKINSFDEFPYDEMTRIVDSIKNLGYDASIIGNGNIVFKKRNHIVGVSKFSCSICGVSWNDPKHVHKCDGIYR